MSIVLTILSILIWIASAGCWIFILVDAFQDAIWKGLLCLLCGFYLLIYALFEFEHENKWLIFLGAFGGSTVAAGILTLR